MNLKSVGKNAILLASHSAFVTDKNIVYAQSGDENHSYRQLSEHTTNKYKIEYNAKVALMQALCSE